MILERFRMTDRVAIVTGAGRGIGAGIALALAEMGARVVCAARTAAAIEEVAEKARGLAGASLAVPCDVTDRTQLERLVERSVAEFGRIDVLVNNAGGTPPRPALQTSERMFEEALRFNVTSAFLLSRLAIPHMLAGEGGSIVNISSAMSRLVDSGFVAYGTAKAALNHMTRLLAREFAPRVRVNAIAVGAVETEALLPFLGLPGLRARLEAQAALGRIGCVEDVAVAALYLASPASSWVTGKILEVDGGTEASTFRSD
jgi:7-alpha-hydroxysteroid dehydrogenase